MAIEFKKFFMNEWTGELYHEQFDAIKEALQVHRSRCSRSINKFDRLFVKKSTFCVALHPWSTTAAYQ